MKRAGLFERTVRDTLRECLAAAPLRYAGDIGEPKAVTIRRGGGLDWGQVRPLMVKHLEPLAIKCTVWEPE